MAGVDKAVKELHCRTNRKQKQEINSASGHEFKNGTVS